MAITEEIMADFATFFYFSDLPIRAVLLFGIFLFYFLNIPFSKKENIKEWKGKRREGNTCLSKRFKTFGSIFKKSLLRELLEQYKITYMKMTHLALIYLVIFILLSKKWKNPLVWKTWISFLPKKKNLKTAPWSAVVFISISSRERERKKNNPFLMTLGH